MKKTRLEVVQTVAISSIISSQRSYADFSMRVHENLPKYFGFEGIGILFTD